MAEKEALAKTKLNAYMKAKEKFYNKFKPTKTKMPLKLWDDAGDYEGVVVNNTPHGYGVWKSTTDVELSYKGDFKYGVAHGHGKKFVKGKLHYEGSFKKS